MRRRGIALVLVLWVVVFAGLLLLGVQQAARVQVALSHAELAAVEAHWLARAGVEQALAVLEDDDASVDSPDDQWHVSWALFDRVELGRGMFSVTARDDRGDPRPGLFDENARLSVNSADKTDLAQLPQMSGAMADAVIDWRDGDDNPQPAGAERGYYQGATFPYEIRNAPFQTHRELLLVKGFEDGRFFGRRGSALAATGPAANTSVYAYDPNRDSAGQERLNLNTADEQTLRLRLSFSQALAQAVVQKRGQQKFDKVMALLDVRPSGSQPAARGSSEQQEITQITLAWLAENLEELSINDDQRLPARVNINTASRDVLLALPQMDAEAADAIIARRASASGPFQHLGQLADSKIIDEARFRAIGEKLTVRSNVFTVESTGVTTWGVQRKVLAVIDRSGGSLRVLYWYQSE